MEKIKENFKVFWWSIKLACRISPKEFFFWIIFSGMVAVLPSVVLISNRNVVAVLTNYLITGQGQFSDIMEPICVLGFVLILSGLSQRVNRELLRVVMNDKYHYGMQEYLMDAIQRVDMKTLHDKAYFDDYRYCTNRGGSLVSFMSSGCYSIMKLISAISLVSVAFTVSVPIGVVASLGFIVSVTANIRISYKMVRDVFHYIELEAEAEHYSLEMKKPGVAKEMRVYQNQDNLLKKWCDAYEKVQDYDRSYAQKRTKNSTFISAGLYFITFLMLLFSVYQVAQGSLGVDIFLMIYLLGENLADVNKNFTSSLSEAMNAFNCLKFQHRFLHRVPMQEERILDKEAIQNSIACQKEQSDIVFEGKNLCFAYDGQEEVLHNLNFQIKKGETIALVGSNGSGKSTLVKLLVDLYRADGGDLLFYGKPYQDYPMGSINKEIGMFFQDYYVYHLSLRENVGFGNLKALKEDGSIHTALEKGGALGILEKCKGNLEQWLIKHVDKTGISLSGGESQKIVVARTHMTDKEILIFDEPAAALDPIAEMEQFQNIKTKTSGKTSILISHRVGFARMADQIFVLDKGRLVEVGTHEELLEKNGIYANFFHQQAQWYEEV